MTTPSERREAFIKEIVEVCKRHRVITEVSFDFVFQAFVGIGENGKLFTVDMGDIDAVLGTDVDEEEK